MLKRGKVQVLILLVLMAAAMAFLVYYISTPAETHDHPEAHQAHSENLPHERLYSDLVNSFNSDPESPIVCYRKNHRNFYIIIFFLAFVLLLLTSFFLFRFRRLNALVKKKNKELEFVHGELNASIDYASNLHKVVLPYAKLDALLPNSFVLYKPCQKIGGDFFWISRHEKALVLGVIDCTGHGVPGALISMASFDLLKRIINESNCHDPAEILSQLNTEFISLFDPTANKLHDGLDIALVSMNEVDGRLLFAGAGNGLYFSDGQSIQEIKGRREGIGGYEYTQKAEFENVEIPYNAELTYYLYSDGLSDQFGGPQNKKMGRQRLKEFLIKLEGETMERRLRKVQTFFAEWKGENEQIDDVTLIGFKVKEL